MFMRVSLVAGIACLVVVAVNSVAQAQGTVAWSPEYPQGVDTVPPPPMFVPGQIKVKGTQAPAAGWGFSSASVIS